MHLIYEALKKAGGKTDGEALIAAAKGMTWESPRGPISIDPETRDIIQTIYIRKVEKVGNDLRQRRVRQGRERQGPGEGRNEKQLDLSLRQNRQADDHRPPAAAFGEGDARPRHRLRLRADAACAPGTPSIMWAKLSALAEGARIASRELLV